MSDKIEQTAISVRVTPGVVSLLKTTIQTLDDLRVVKGSRSLTQSDVISGLVGYFAARVEREGRDAAAAILKDGAEIVAARDRVIASAGDAVLDLSSPGSLLAPRPAGSVEVIQPRSKSAGRAR